MVLLVPAISCAACRRLLPHSHLCWSACAAPSSPFVVIVSSFNSLPTEKAMSDPEWAGTYWLPQYWYQLQYLVTGIKFLLFALKNSRIVISRTFLNSNYLLDNMFDCCTQRNKNESIGKTKSKRPLTPRRQQVEELARSWAQERVQRSASLLEEQLQRASTPVDDIFSCICTGKTENGTKKKSSSSSPLKSMLTASGGVALHAIASLPPSPSSAARRKKAEPLPIPVEAVPCDNFDCMTCEVQDSEWTVARLGARVFRFCSQECWTTWLENPGHHGSWSSPLLSYQSSPGESETSPTASRDSRSFTDSPLMSELGRRRPVNILDDLPPLMI